LIPPLPPADMLVIPVAEPTLNAPPMLMDPLLVVIRLTVLPLTLPLTTNCPAVVNWNVLKALEAFRVALVLLVMKTEPAAADAVMAFVVI
jgi:hypothetical protein